MAVATTHDLPTLRGYWESGDLTLGKTLGLYPDEVVLRGLYQDRELAKQGLLDALHKHGCLPKRAGHKASLMAMTRRSTVGCSAILPTATAPCWACSRKTG
jgi:4-alpha-glucanotransferase